MNEANQSKPIKEVYIGADPEFLILDGFKILDASMHDYTIRNYGSIGHDGHRFIAELRPNYSSDPLQVVRNMREILVSKINHSPKFGDYNFYAGSHYREKSLGGHIHFSSNFPEFKQMSKANFLHFTQILDNYVAACSILLENVEDGKKRRKSGDYGFYGDWRPQNWGFEHRTCSSWISSPHIANSLLCLSKVVMHEILNNPNFPFKVFNCNDDFHYMKVDNLRKRFPQIWADIQRMSLYNQYKPYLHLIYNFVNQKRTWHPKHLKLKEAWGIISIPEERKENSPRFKTISLDSIWGKEFKKNNDEDTYHRKYNDYWDAPAN